MKGLAAALALVLSAVPSSAQQPSAEQTPTWKDHLSLMVSGGRRTVGSNSMRPTMKAGDQVRFDSRAYLHDGPARGDVVLVRNPHDERFFIRRIIGLPGDRVQMKAGRLYLNGVMVARTEPKKITYREQDGRVTLDWEVTQYREKLPGEAGSHLIYEVNDRDRLDETPLFVVPEGRYFLMGDHRDNSEDSRSACAHLERLPAEADAWSNDMGRSRMSCSYQPIGFAPRANILGRAAR